MALLRAESARQDSARAARLERGHPAAAADHGLAGVTGGRRPVKGDTQQDLYNIQQQLVQLQELTGQSQQRLTELRTQLEARGAQIESPRPPAAPGDSAPAASGPPAPRRTRCTRRRWRSSAGAARHRPARPARAAADVSHERAGARRALLHRPELRSREPRLGRGLLPPGGGQYPKSPRAARPCTTSGSSRSGGRTRQGEGRLPAGGAAVSPVRRSRPGPRPAEGARALSPGAPPHDRSPGEMPFLDHLEELRCGFSARSARSSSVSASASGWCSSFSWSASSSARSRPTSPAASSSSPAPPSR